MRGATSASLTWAARSSRKCWRDEQKPAIAAGVSSRWCRQEDVASRKRVRSDLSFRKNDRSALPGALFAAFYFRTSRERPPACCTVASTPCAANGTRRNPPMTDQPRDSGDRDQRLQDVIAAYLDAEKDGAAPAREEWLARHPDLTDD